MITDKSKYGHDAVLDLDCGDAVQVLRTEPMTLTEEEQAIVRAYLGIMLLNKSYINPNGHLILVMSDGREYDLGTARGLPGATPYLGPNGNWFVEGRDTLQSARGLPGLTPYIKDSYWWIGDTDTGIRAEAKDGLTPNIREGYWYLGDTSLGIRAEAKDGLTPYIRDGYWWIGSENTGVRAEAKDGLTPYIKDGYWWIGNLSTGQPANTLEIANDLNTDDANKVLSAAQGKVLGDKLKKSKRLTFHYEGSDETETIEVYIK